mgnify:CR=1 FL=1
MGHHLGSKSSIIPLIDRLNKYPIGLVDSDKLREILTLLFDEREAFVASCFPLEEATLPELARLTQIQPTELLPLLEGVSKALGFMTQNILDQGGVIGDFHGDDFRHSYGDRFLRHYAERRQ